MKHLWLITASMGKYELDFYKIIEAHRLYEEAAERLKQFKKEWDQFTEIISSLGSTVQYLNASCPLPWLKDLYIDFNFGKCDPLILEILEVPVYEKKGKKESFI